MATSAVAPSGAAPPPPPAPASSSASTRLRRFANQHGRGRGRGRGPGRTTGNNDGLVAHDATGKDNKPCHSHNHSHSHAHAHAHCQPNTSNTTACHLPLDIRPDYTECTICTEQIDFYSVGECNHRVCYTCSLRLRALYKSDQCPYCKAVLADVVITASHVAPFESFGRLSALPFHDNLLRAHFDSHEAATAARHLQEFRCPGCKTHVADTWGALRQHVADSHSKLAFCDICVEHKRVFAAEHSLYSARSLRTHCLHGDGAIQRHIVNPDVSFHGGHPECRLCRLLFFCADDLFRHCRQNHEECFVCQQNGVMHAYYRDYDALEKHFRSSHYVCRARECLEKKFVVFQTESDLRIHEISIHLKQTGHSSANPQRARLAANARLSLTFNPGHGSTTTSSSGSSMSTDIRGKITSLSNDSNSFGGPSSTAFCLAPSRRTQHTGTVSSSFVSASRPTPATATATPQAPANVPVSSSSSRVRTQVPRPSSAPYGTFIDPGTVVGPSAAILQLESQLVSTQLLNRPANARLRAPVGFGQLTDRIESKPNNSSSSSSSSSESAKASSRTNNAQKALVPGFDENSSTRVAGHAIQGEAASLLPCQGTADGDLLLSAQILCTLQEYLGNSQQRMLSARGLLVAAHRGEMTANDFCGALEALGGSQVPARRLRLIAAMLPVNSPHRRSIVQAAAQKFLNKPTALEAGSGNTGGAKGTSHSSSSRSVENTTNNRNKSNNKSHGKQNQSRAGGPSDSSPRDQGGSTRSATASTTTTLAQRLRGAVVAVSQDISSPMAMRQRHQTSTAVIQTAAPLGDSGRMWSDCLAVRGNRLPMASVIARVTPSAYTAQLAAAGTGNANGSRASLVSGQPSQVRHVQPVLSAQAPATLVAPAVGRLRRGAPGKRAKRAIILQRGISGMI